MQRWEDLERGLEHSANDGSRSVTGDRSIVSVGFGVIQCYWKNSGLGFECGK
jgi:hypothetical protein